MKRMMSATMDDGTAVTGEYVGAQDGYLYLSDGDEVVRLEQARVTFIVSMVAQPDPLPDLSDE